jgi:hypothetical protein
MENRSFRTARAGVAFVATLVVLAAAQAAGAETPKVRIVAADQALARAATVQRGDLGSAHWDVKQRRPDLTDTRPCEYFDPKASDLRVTGAFESEFVDRAGGVYINSEAHVFQHARMAELNWRRNVANPTAARCTREVASRQKEAKLVSFAQQPLRSVGARRALRYRLVFEHAASGLRRFGDIVIVADGRVEITLAVGGAFDEVAAADRVEQVLLRRLLARARG